MLFAGAPKGTLGDAYGFANLYQVQRPAPVCFQIFLELRNDLAAVPIPDAPFDGSPIRQTFDHQAGKLLFQRARHLRERKNIATCSSHQRGSSMRVQQLRHQGWTWPNKMRQRFLCKFMTSYSLARDIEIIERQRHRSPAAGGFGSPMQNAGGVDDDINWRKGHTTTDDRWVACTCEKANYPAAWTNCPDTDPWQTFVAMLHPQLVQTDFREDGTEFAFCCRK